MFEHSTYLDRFLSDLRGKKVRRFDFEELWSGRKEKGESSQQVLYLWCHRTDRSQNTISFYANKEKGRIDGPPTYEYRAHWFEAPIILTKPKNSIHLRLKRPGPEIVDDSDALTPPAKRRSTSFRKLTHFRLSDHSSPDVGKASPSSLPTPPASGSVSGNTSQKSPETSTGEKNPEDQVQRDIVNKFGWLAVQFPSSNGR